MNKADEIHRTLARVVDFLAAGSLAGLLASPFGIFLAALYILVADGFFNGQSLGKKLFKIKVIVRDLNQQQRACTFKDSMIRNCPFAIFILIGSIPFFGWFFMFIGLIFTFAEGYFVIMDEKGVRMGDVYANSFVVNEIRDEN